MIRSVPPLRHARTGLVLLAVLALLTATVVVATGTGGLRAAAADGAFVSGSGSASAEALSVNPSLGSESLGFEIGVALANYADVEGQAQSQTLDPGTLLGLVDSGSVAQLQGVETESEGAPTTKSLVVSGGQSGPAAVGTELVNAAQSSSSATTTLVAINVPGALDISGGAASASSAIVGGQTRQSQGSARIGSVSLLAGLIVLNGLNWQATARSGASTTQSATFSIASVTVAGTTIPVAVDSLSAVFSVINTALATTGFHISVPQSVVGADGSVQETPLTIGIDNSTLGHVLVGPVVKEIQPLRTELLNVLLGVSASAGTANLLLEAGLAILAGQGSVDVNLGGAYATTSDVTYANPLTGSTSSEGGGSPTDVLPDTGSGAGSPLTSSLGQGGGGSSLGGSPTAAPTPKATPLRVQALGSSERCLSTTVGGCRSGGHELVIVILLGLTLALVLAEFIRLRRRWRLTSVRTP